MSNVYSFRDGSKMDLDFDNLHAHEEIRAYEERFEEIRDNCYLNQDILLEALSADAWPEEYEDISEDIGIYLKSYSDLTRDKTFDSAAYAKLLSKMPKEIQNLALIGYRLAQYAIPYIEDQATDRLWEETGI